MVYYSCPMNNALGTSLIKKKNKRQTLRAKRGSKPNLSICLDSAFSAEHFYVCVLHFMGPTLQCVKINTQLFPAETQDEINLNAPFQ